MFGFIRWIFLLGIIVALLGFLVGKPIHGRTPAESFCKLIDSADCARLADRGAAQMGWAKNRWDAAAGSSAPAPTSSPAPSKVAAHESVRTPHASAPAPTSAPAPVAVATPDAAPLDRHTPTERHALDRILTQHGSR